MNMYASIAESAARVAGDYIQSRAADISDLLIEQKSLNDYVSEVDRQSEQMIFDIIRAEFPEHCFLGEEFGSSGISQADYQWIVDPLDGTTNFLRGIPHYAVSIALQFKGEIIQASVYDPSKNDMFSATKGHGASLNGRSIKVSAATTIKGGLYATGIPFNGLSLENLGCFTDCVEEVLNRQTAGIRRLGSAALDLAYVAAGRYDGYWEANLQPWDIAAGLLLVKEAGGVIRDLSGAEGYLQNGHILAACPGAFDDLLEISVKAYSQWHTS